MTWDTQYDFAQTHEEYDDYDEQDYYDDLFDEQHNETPPSTTPIREILPTENIQVGRVYRLPETQNSDDNQQQPDVIDHIRNIRPLRHDRVYNFEEFLKILPPQ